MLVSQRIIQLCVAFQNGFFWPSLIRAVSGLIDSTNLVNPSPGS